MGYIDYEISKEPVKGIVPLSKTDIDELRCIEKAIKNICCRRLSMMKKAYPKKKEDPVIEMLFSADFDIAYAMNRYIPSGSAV